MSWIFQKMGVIQNFVKCGVSILPNVAYGFIRPSLAQEPCLVRWTRYGNEYRANNLQRKRKHGFLARLRTKAGRRILKHRREKQRKFLSH